MSKKQQPESANNEDAAYTLSIIQGDKRAQADIEAGRVHSTEKIKRDFGLANMLDQKER